MARVPLQQDAQQKAKNKARRSGPSVLNKTKELGTIAQVFAATVYWDPTHLCYRVKAHVPEGENVPDVNSLVGAPHSPFSLTSTDNLSDCERDIRSKDPKQPQKRNTEGSSEEPQDRGSTAS